MRVLIIEDDGALGLFLQKGLKLEGHEVALVADGEAGLDYALTHCPDLIVLDLSLPKRDGIEVLESMRDHLKQTSVLVLTGRSAVEERVRCLNMGADDCLLKPFSFHELTARCRVLLRRREQFADPTLRHGGVELNRMERKVTRDGRAIDLTGKEFALLEFLMQARGRCCTRGELLKEVWQMSPDAGTNVVDVYVNYLRKKLGAGESTGDGPVIETVRGEGYMLGVGAAKKPVLRASSVFGLGARAHA